MKDAFSPIEESWDGWELDMEKSSSVVVYAKVPQRDILRAVELGWMIEKLGPIKVDKDLGHIEMFLSVDQEIIFQ